MAQQGGQIIIDTICSGNDKPIPCIKGKIIQIDCDTLYLINKMRFKLYEEAKQAVLKGGSYEVLIQNYEESLNEQDSYYQKLLEKNRQLDSNSQNIVRETKATLVQVEHSLSQSSLSLDLANKNLEEANKLIKKERKNGMWNKLFVGAGTFTMGILTGILLGK